MESLYKSMNWSGNGSMKCKK